MNGSDPNLEDVARRGRDIFARIVAEQVRDEPTQTVVAIDVADMPGHQLRAYEIHRTFPADPPVINGLALKEIWTSGVSDTVDQNGTAAAQALPATFPSTEKTEGPPQHFHQGLMCRNVG